MRIVDKLPGAEELKRSREADTKLETFLKAEMEDAISARISEEILWKDELRQYQGIPKEPFSRDVAAIRNLEVPLGAIASDTITAQAFDAIFSASPIITVRGASRYEQHAKAVQTLLNHFAVDPFVNLKPAATDSLLDCIQLGTGAYYIVWGESYKKTGVYTIQDRGPRIFSPPIEDIIVPGASTPDVQNIRLVAYRTWLTGGELRLRGEQLGWDWELAGSTNAINMIRRRREEVAHTREPTPGTDRFYEIYDIYVDYDYDGDNFDEDLLVTWDRTAGKVLKVQYNPYDVRPFEISRYQAVAHMFFGMGVLQMIGPFQIEVTDWHNFRMANARLANSRAWAVKIGSSIAGDKLKITPDKTVPLAEAKDLAALAMADIYPSALQYEAATIQLAERRVGTMTDFSTRPMPGHRTAGVTMQAVLAQINRRFAPAFDNMKEAMSNSLRQCLLRMQEQYKLGKENKQYIERFLGQLLGPKEAPLVVEILRGDSQLLEDNITVEMTATTQSINREMDKQNSMMMMQVLGGYYEKMMNVAMVMTNPQAPPPLKELGAKLAKASTEAMDRFLRTFDNVRNPALFLLSEEDLAKLESAIQNGLGGLGDLGAGPSGQAPGGSPPSPVDEILGGGSEVSGANPGVGASAPTGAGGA